MYIWEMLWSLCLRPAKISLLILQPCLFPKLQGVWVILGENRVSVKSLVAVLSSFVLAAKTKGANVQQRVCGLYAASVYLLLLGIPGEHIWKQFVRVSEMTEF